MENHAPKPLTDPGEIQAVLDGMNDNLKTVLYHSCNGLTPAQIAAATRHDETWVRNQMTEVYKRLSYTRLNTTDKHDYLEKYVRALVPPTLDEFKGQGRARPRTRPEPQPRVERRPRPPIHVHPLLAGIVGAGLTCIILYFVFSAFPQLFPPIFPARPTRTPQPTRTPRPSPIVPPTDTLTPTITLTPTPLPPTLTFTPVPPTFTDTTVPPTFTAVPTPEFYTEGKWVSLTDKINIHLDTIFGSCSSLNGWSVILNIKPATFGQFLLRYDPNDFMAQDDIGTEYPLDHVFSMTYGADVRSPQDKPVYFQDLCLAFQGHFPQEAHYLIITVENINGVRLVFHKVLQ